MTRSRTTRSHPIRALLPAVLCATLAALAGCSSSTAISTDTSPTTSPTSSAAGRRTVTVLAASSLTEPFAALATAYEQAHPDVTVRVSYGSSTTLAQQVTQGAPADIVALAGGEAVAQVSAAATATHPPIPFAENALVLGTPAANPARVGVLADLARPDVAVVLCVATAPCGRAADTALAGAGVTAHVVSREVDAKATLTQAPARRSRRSAALPLRCGRRARCGHRHTAAQPVCRVRHLLPGPAHRRARSRRCRASADRRRRADGIPGCGVRAMTWAVTRFVARPEVAP
ncbi:MAG: molybdate ABC transporter substrate-binding protein [Actinomycetales bacterium]|nr:molybdate ABC transporter substrate-binding protein [Actinomycetales bacterium]